MSPNNCCTLEQFYTDQLAQPALLGLIFAISLMVGCTDESEWQKHRDAAEQFIQQGHYDEAKQSLEMALTEANRLGPGSLQEARTLHQLGELFRVQGEYAKAEAYFWKVLPLWVQSAGPESLEMAQSLHSLALLFQARGQLANAKPLLKRSLAIQEKVHGPTHPSLIPSLEQYGKLLQTLDSQKEASTIMSRVNKMKSEL